MPREKEKPQNKVLFDTLIRRDQYFKVVKFSNKQRFKGSVLRSIQRLANNLDKDTAEAQADFNKNKI